MDKLARVESASLVQQGDVVSELPQIFALASKLMQARGFIPQHLKTEGEVAAAIIAGRELGLQPMTALRSIYLVNGKVGLSADMQLALMKRAGIRHEWIADGSDCKAARLKLERNGDRPYIQSYTIEDADRAGLLRNPTWKAHTPAMLRARCVSSAGRAYAPDVLSGVYVPEELELFAVSSLPAAEAAAPVSEPPQYDVVTGEVEQPQTQTTPADEIRQLVEVDLPGCLTRETLVAWARELHAIKATSKAKESAWKMWAAVCETRELSPRDLADEARKAA